LETKLIIVLHVIDVVAFFIFKKLNSDCKQSLIKIYQDAVIEPDSKKSTPDKSEVLSNNFIQ